MFEYMSAAFPFRQNLYALHGPSSPVELRLAHVPGEYSD